MTEQESRESRMVVLRRNADGTPSVWCDPEIADLVQALNGGGVPTVASCSGHGERVGNIALADGRELVIVPNRESAENVLRSLDYDSLSFLYALLGADNDVEARNLWARNPGVRHSAYEGVKAALVRRQKKRGDRPGGFQPKKYPTFDAEFSAELRGEY